MRLAVVLLLVTQAGMLGYSATRHAPTHLEPAFLASGISHWKFERFELYRVNPPLVRMVAALPVMAAGFESDWSSFHEGPGARSEFPIGEGFVKANGVRSVQLFWYARWACIPFSLLGAYFAWRWAAELYGAAAGLLTLILFVFEPNLLAHGELVTPDGACTAFGIVAGYSFWRWMRAPSWTRAALAGGALGLAQLSKMSWLLLFGLWPVLWLFWRVTAAWSGRRARQDRERCHESPGDRGDKSGDSSAVDPDRRHLPGMVQLAGILGIAVYLINLGYAFDGTGTALKDFTFVSRTLSGLEKPGTPGNRFHDTVWSEVPVPFPRQYVLGFDAQKKDFEDFGHRSYLRGVWQDGGWWYYYLYGLLVKVPCGIWGILAVVLLTRLIRRLRPGPWHVRKGTVVSGNQPERVSVRFRALSAEIGWRDEVILLGPVVALLVLVSSQTEFSIHLRYAFPALGLALIFVGQAVSPRVVPLRFGRLLAGGLACWSVASCLLVYPDHLAYFNDFVGGMENGRHHLMGSSLDWEQGTLEVVDWVADSGWTGPVEWRNRSVTLATALLDERRKGLPGQDRDGRMSEVLGVYHADAFYDPQGAPQYSRILHRFRFGTVVVVKQP